jgi:transcriptional regulator with XRE-family HTH domain
MSDVNIGEHIKNVVEQRGYSITEFAKRINKSRENVYSIFTRKSIDTALLQTISTILDYDFFALFNDNESRAAKEIDQLTKENILLKEMIELLKKQIKA